MRACRCSVCKHGTAAPEPTQLHPFATNHTHTGILVSVNFNIQSFRSALTYFSSWSSLVPLQYRSLASFGMFRLVFLAFLLFPTFLLVARSMAITWPYAWVDPLLRHSLFLAIFVALAVVFSPTDKEAYRRPFVLEPWRGREGGRPAGTGAAMGAGALA